MKENTLESSSQEVAPTQSGDPESKEERIVLTDERSLSQEQEQSFEPVEDLGMQQADEGSAWYLRIDRYNISLPESLSSFANLFCPISWNAQSNRWIGKHTESLNLGIRVDRIQSKSYVGDLRFEDALFGKPITKLSAHWNRIAVIAAALWKDI